MTALPSHDQSGRTDPRAITTDRTGLTATEVDGSVNLLDAVRAEGRSRRLATILMLMALAALAETKTPELEYAE